VFLSYLNFFKGALLVSFNRLSGMISSAVRQIEGFTTAILRA
jgi:hypothetical protein